MTTRRCRERRQARRAGAENRIPRRTAARQYRRTTRRVRRIGIGSQAGARIGGKVSPSGVPHPPRKAYRLLTI
ncbi:hypothetical protein Asp14428_35700 [Actinoplanes sp. NBRC 14428]|nr:hypothetical protein Asp14428_35700 [Actinoplanes sp. NBRC 14428]